MGPEIVVIMPHLHGLNGHQQKGPAAAGAARTTITHSGQEIASIALGPEHWGGISKAAAVSGNAASPDVHLFLEFFFSSGVNVKAGKSFENVSVWFQHFC